MNNESKAQPSKQSIGFDPELLKAKEGKILRRYISLPKLIDLFRTNKLYLEQASSLEDKLEGTLPEAIRQSYRDHNGSDPVFEENKLKEQTYLNCWTLGAKDNIALWKIYGGGLKECVAITTTTKKLAQESCNWDSHGLISVKKVKYIDHAGVLPDGLYSLSSIVFGLKHVAYAFEKEVRIIVDNRNLHTNEVAPSHIKLPVDLNNLLRSIVVAPEAGEWFFDLVLELKEKYGIQAPVKRSSLTHLIHKAK